MLENEIAYIDINSFGDKTTGELQIVLDELLAQLRAANIDVVGGPESHENGKFAWIMDPDGNKVELWEPMLWDARNKSP